MSTRMIIQRDGPFGLVVLLVFALCAPAAAQPYEYAITWLDDDLDVPFCWDVGAYVHDINDLGQAVGAVMMRCEGATFDNEHAVIWLPQPAYGLDAGVHDMGGVPDCGDDARANAINDDGRVVGRAYDDPYYYCGAAFRWDAGPGDPVILWEDTWQAEATDVNNHGQVVGKWYDYDIDDTRGVVWEQGSLHEPDWLIGKEPRAMNDSAEIVGGNWVYDYDGGQGALLQGCPGYSGTEALAINEWGVIVGYCSEGYTLSVPALWSSSTASPQELGSLGGSHGEALDINDCGVVVGWSHTSGNQPHAFVYDPQRDLRDLNDLVDWPGTLAYAKAVNCRRQIVCESSGGYACLLTPLCPGDLDKDWSRNVSDFTIFASAYGSQIGQPAYNSQADMNCDGFINITDFTQFAVVFGVPCP